jgi:hypothetical protein
VGYRLCPTCGFGGAEDFSNLSRVSFLEQGKSGSGKAMAMLEKCND